MNDNDKSKKQRMTPPPRPKRKSTPPPVRGTGSPPPHPKTKKRSSSNRKSRFASKQMVVVGGIGLFCIGILITGAMSFSGLVSAKPTTAMDYTSNEVREIMKLLRYDAACRDTRLGDYFQEDKISLELLNAVLGQPVSKAGRYPRLIWTYRTSDGSATITPFTVHEIGGRMPEGTIPFLDMQGTVKTIGLNSNHPVDREALKKTILQIKSRFDDGDGEKLYQQRLEQYKKELADEKAETLRRNEQDQKERNERNARMAAEKNARQAKRREQQRMQDEEVAKRTISLEIQKKAYNDYYDIRDDLPFGATKNKFAEQSEEWIKQRKEILESAQKNNNDWKSLSLPTKKVISTAIANGRPIPVVGTKTSGSSSAQQKPILSNDKTTANTKPFHPILTPPKRKPKSQRPQKTTSPQQPNRRRPQLALNKRVSINSPYPNLEFPVNSGLAIKSVYYSEEESQ